MKQNEIYSYIYDYISQLLENPILFSSIKKIILFGSIARGDFDKESDIDLFIEIKNLEDKKDIEKMIEKNITSFEVRAEKTWALRGIHFPIKTLVGSFEEERWKELHQEILSYAIILYGPFQESPQQLHNSFLLMYDIRKLVQRKKMAFLRSLFSSVSFKKKKKYVSKGVLDKVGGTKVGSQAILVPREGFLPVKSLFKKYHVPYTVKEVWER